MPVVVEMPVAKEDDPVAQNRGKGRRDCAAVRIPGQGNDANFGAARSATGPRIAEGVCSILQSIETVEQPQTADKTFLVRGGGRC